MNGERGIGGRRRRVALLGLSALSVLGVSMVLAAAPATGRGGAASAPATRSVSAADKKAAEDQFDKANALYKQGKFSDAQTENEKALKLDPGNTNALLMRQVLEGKLAGGDGGRASAGGGGGSAPGKFSVLTMQQVSLIRAIEGNAADHLTGKFDPKALEDFWNAVVVKDPLEDKTKAAHDRFVNAANFPLQLSRIKGSNELKYLQGATITSDPAVMKAFVSQGGVNSYVMQNCATLDCHAGTSKSAGNFRLANPASNAEQQYTNFFILSMYSNADGKMLDRDNPERSLLLQYSLPYAVASVKHPKSDIRRISGLNDQRLRSMSDWIKSLAFPKPNYGIVYEVPSTVPAATQGAK